MELQRRHTGAGRSEKFRFAGIADSIQASRPVRPKLAFADRLLQVVRRALSMRTAPGSMPSWRSGAVCRCSYSCCCASTRVWRPADSAGLGQADGTFELGGNYRNELLRARMARTVSASRSRDSLPEYPEAAPRPWRSHPDLPPTGRSAGSTPALPERVGPHLRRILGRRRRAQRHASRSSRTSPSAASGRPVSGIPPGSTAGARDRRRHRAGLASRHYRPQRPHRLGFYD